MAAQVLPEPEAPNCPGTMASMGWPSFRGPTSCGGAWTVIPSSRVTFAHACSSAGTAGAGMDVTLVAFPAYPGRLLVAVEAVCCRRDASGLDVEDQAPSSLMVAGIPPG